MQEMLIVGRGGEGVVLASQVLADAFARAGMWAQSFPEFKAERRGAPISAFLRWDETSPIHRRYKVRDCDVLVCVSPSPPSDELLRSVRPGGLVILNRDGRFAHSGPFEIARVPASRIARDHGILSSEGRPMGNVAVLGACVRLLLPDGLLFLEEAIAARMGAAADLNVVAAREGYARCTRQRTRAGDAPIELTLDAPLPTPRPDPPLFPVSTTDSRGHPHRVVVARTSGAHGRLHRMRPLRALLPRGGNRAERRLHGRRLPLLQGLRDLRGRLSRPERDRDGGGAGMSATLLHGRTVLTADEAAAHAVTLARAQAIGCYPITPQTIIVERLADLTAGRDDVEFANLESEHAMLGYVIAASRVGVRTFTATSSQGLLFAHEQLHRASRERVPLVMVNINRSILAPWSLEPDLSDSMSQRDTGWIQLYCASVQEVLDCILCAYRIAETVMLPVMVCAEGFLLSHTAEVVDIPEQSAVDAFLPGFSPPDDWVLDPDRPRTFSALPQPADYSAFQRRVADAMDEARSVVETVASEFTTHFGRRKVGAIDVAGNPDAKAALITIGTIGDSALELLDEDDDLLLLRVHTFRPFPAAEISDALAGCSYVSVVDRAAAFGSLGPLGADVRSLGLAHAKAVTNFVCGLGGTEVTPVTLRWALEHTRSGAERTPGYVPVTIPEEVH